MKIEITWVDELYSDPTFESMVEEYASYAIKTLPRPQYKRQNYELMEKSGSMTPFRVTHENRLIGFMNILEAKILHYSLKLSIVESLFVLKQYRYTGAGIRLIKTAESFSRLAGRSGLFVSCPVHGELVDVLPRMGYSLETHNFFKRL